MLHNKQFAILKKPLFLPDYHSVTLADGWTLYYHELLPVCHNAAAQVTLLGHAWQVMPGKPSPAEQITALTDRFDLSALLTEEESWCGRYVMIAGGKVYLDAAGSLGVFYSADGVSSDVQLLAECMGKELRIYQGLEKLTWCPGPMTAYPDIFRLLPSQAYDYQQQALSDHSLMAASYQPILDDEELLNRFTALFCHSLRSLEAMFPKAKLLVAVTGGFDSRTVLALAKHAGIRFECFTMQHDQMSVGDLEVPRQLCERIQVPYTYIERDKSLYDAQREQEHIQHVGGTYHAKDRLYYTHHQYDELVQRFGDIVLLRGNIWEVAQDSYRRFYSEQLRPEEIIEYYYLSPDAPEAEAIRSYMAWCRQHPQPGISLRSRFDWEQNMAGCWMTEGEHGFDLYDHIVSLQPLNCRLLISMLFTFPAEERFVRHHQTRITALACPAFDGVPYGSEKIAGQTLLGRVTDKLRREMKRLQRTGLKSVLRTYQKTISSKLDQKHHQF